MFGFYPVVGILVTAWFKALGTAHHLHDQVGLAPSFLFFLDAIYSYRPTQYFEAKKMTRHQIVVFMEERKWDYWSTSRSVVRSVDG